MNNQILPRVLIVEDQLNWRRLYNIWLKNHCQATFCTSRSEALESVKNELFDIIIMDLGLPEPEEGIRTIEDILSFHKLCKIIVVSAHTQREIHLRVQQLGVYAVFQKDERLESELPVLIRKASEMLSLEKENLYLRQQIEEKTEQPRILGESALAESLRKKIRNISRTDTPVLITGPTGSGKTYTARLIHLLSPRANKPYVQINCANLPANLVESELFGHTRGAFTGAETASAGKFKAADGGTVLLDEIGDLPVSIQAKLLQVIEEKSFFPVGSHQEISVDVRIIASTNRDLRMEMKNGNFREDLFYRLAGFSLHIPGLSERKDDIPVYFDYFLDLVCREEGLPRPEVEAQVYRMIRDYPWRGNLRELKNTITRLLLFHPEKITGKDFMEQISPTSETLLTKALHKNYSLKEISALYAQELYRHIPRKKEVARILGIDHKTLNRYLNMKVEK